MGVGMCQTLWAGEWECRRGHGDTNGLGEGSQLCDENSGHSRVFILSLAEKEVDEAYSDSDSNCQR